MYDGSIPQLVGARVQYVGQLRVHDIDSEPNAEPNAEPDAKPDAKPDAEADPDANFGPNSYTDNYNGPTPTLTGV